MTNKPNRFRDIIAARQEEPPRESDMPEPPMPLPEQAGVARARTSTSKRGNPDYSAVTVYVPTEIYARAQYMMTRNGRKREMSALFTELLEAWLKTQS